MSLTYDELTKKIGWGSDRAVLDETKVELLNQWVVGKRVLDAGCATGVYSHYLSTKGFAVTGVDHNPRLLALAKKRSQIVIYTKAEIARLPYKNKSFDTVIAFDVLEHVDEAVAMKELVRVARKRIILCIPQTTDINLSRLYLLYGHHIDPTHQRTYTPADVKKLLAAHTLRPLLVQSTHPLSTDALFLALFSAPLFIRRLLRKISFLIGKPRQFYTNIMVVAEVG